MPKGKKPEMVPLETRLLTLRSLGMTDIADLAGVGQVIVSLMGELGYVKARKRGARGNGTAKAKMQAVLPLSAEKV